MFYFTFLNSLFVFLRNFTTNKYDAEYTQRQVAIIHSTYVSLYSLFIMFMNVEDSYAIDLFSYVIQHDIYDSVINLYYSHEFPRQKVVTSMLHHIVVVLALNVCSIYNIPIVNKYVTQLVLCEISSPLLDMGKIIIKYHKDYKMLLHFIKPLFIFLFFSLRIVNMTYVSYILYFKTPEEIPYELEICLDIIVAIFTSLQYYWFYLILKRVFNN